MARPYCESNCELAQVCTYLAYGGLLRKDGVWASSLPVPGQETNDTAEAARVAGALREDRGLCCSSSTVPVACKLHGPSLRDTRGVRVYPSAASIIVVSVAVSELKKWRTEGKRTKPKTNTRVFTKFCIRPRQKLHRCEGRIMTQTMVTQKQKQTR